MLFERGRGLGGFGVCVGEIYGLRVFGRVGFGLVWGFRGCGFWGSE